MPGVGRWLALRKTTGKVATGNVKLFLNQDTINDYFREQGMSELQGGLQQLLLGSVVGKVLHLVDCPVLLIK